MLVKCRYRDIDNLGYVKLRMLDDKLGKKNDLRFIPRKAFWNDPNASRALWCVTQYRKIDPEKHSQEYEFMGAWLKPDGLCIEIELNKNRPKKTFVYKKEKIK